MDTLLPSLLLIINPLTSLKNLNVFGGFVTWWSFFLQHFDFQFQYKQGTAHTNTDSSHRPLVPVTFISELKLLEDPTKHKTMMTFSYKMSTWLWYKGHLQPIIHPLPLVSVTLTWLSLHLSTMRFFITSTTVLVTSEWNTLLTLLRCISTGPGTKLTLLNGCLIVKNINEGTPKQSSHKHHLELFRHLICLSSSYGTLWGQFLQMKW